MSASPPPFVHLNGHLLPATAATVSVFDRGFQYGDGLFDTLRTYNGAPFQLAQHIQRLQRSAHALEIPLPPRPWLRDIHALLARNALLECDAAVRITLTRGHAPRGLLPPPAVQPTVLITAHALDPALVTAQQHGVSVTPLPFARESLLATHKTLHYLPAILGKMHADRAGAFEGLYLTPDAQIQEGTTSNIFLATQGTLLTPPATHILPGLTRQCVLHLAATAQIPVREAPLPLATLLTAGEAFLTSSLMGIVPITTVIHQDQCTPKTIGPLTRHICKLYGNTITTTLAKMQEP